MLLIGSPETRRQFIDDLLEQTQVGFGTLRRRYRRILGQRNTLLKQKPRALPDQLFVWDVRLSEYAAQIVGARCWLVAEIDKQIKPLYKKLAHSSLKAGLSYQSLALPEHYASVLLNKLESHREEDIERGYTAYGPHREDVILSLNGHPVQTTASRGETRTLLLAVKMIEALLLEQNRGQRPILLFDDVFSELDGGRRQALTSFLQPYQTFITTTDADIVINISKQPTLYRSRSLVRFHPGVRANWWAVALEVWKLFCCSRFMQNRRSKGLVRKTFFYGFRLQPI